MTARRAVRRCGSTARRAVRRCGSEDINNYHECQASTPNGPRAYAFNNGLPSLARPFSLMPDSPPVSQRLHPLAPAKDTDGNYLTVCQSRETVENGLRLDAVSNFISVTVLSRRPFAQESQ